MNVKFVSHVESENDSNGRFVNFLISRVGLAGRIGASVK